MSTRKMFAACAAGIAMSVVCIDARAGVITVTDKFPGRTVWVTTYNELGQIIGRPGCVMPNGSKTFDHYYYGVHGFKVQVEIKDGPDCRGGNICKTDMWVPGRNRGDNTPVSTIYVHEQRIRGKCYLGYREKPEAHEAIAENMYPNKYVWVTLYDYMHQPAAKRHIVETGCVAPGQRRSFFDNYYENGAYIIRFEVKDGTRGNSRDCGGATLCDTDANPLHRAGSINPKPNRIYPGSGPGRCYIDWK